MGSDVWARLPRRRTGLAVLPIAAVITLAATSLGIGLAYLLPQQSVALVYLLSVMLAALAFGVNAGLAVSVLAFLSYNFFFIPPIYTFTIADRQELFALIVFLVVALLTGSLAGRMREGVDAARRRAVTLQALNEFATALTGARDLSTILDALADRAGATIRGHAVILLKSAEGELQVRGSTPDAPTLDTAEWQAANHAIRSERTVYAAAAGWDGSRIEFQPLVGSAGVIGVVGLKPFDGQRAIDTDDTLALQTIFRQACVAIDRTRLEVEASSARDDVERERLRSALLSSLSHDLRTPLASILGAATSLRELGRDMSPETQADLLIAIEEEAERLSRFVSNLLDMTRLEAKAIDLQRDWVDAADVAQVAVVRARRIFPAANITLACPANLPVIRGDATLFEHVVFNLLDNSVKFSAPGDAIDVVLSADDEHVTLMVVDQGRGIPAEALVRVFETFYRVGDGTVPGTGLGLSICKRIVEGMGGSIRAQSPVNSAGGTRITARFHGPHPVTQA